VKMHSWWKRAQLVQRPSGDWSKPWQRIWAPLARGGRVGGVRRSTHLSASAVSAGDGRPLARGGLGEVHGRPLLVLGRHAMMSAWRIGHVARRATVGVIVGRWRPIRILGHMGGGRWRREGEHLALGRKAGGGGRRVRRRAAVRTGIRLLARRPRRLFVRARQALGHWRPAKRQRAARACSADMERPDLGRKPLGGEREGTRELGSGEDGDGSGRVSGAFSCLGDHAVRGPGSGGGGRVRQAGDGPMSTVPGRQRSSGDGEAFTRPGIMVAAEAEADCGGGGLLAAGKGSAGGGRGTGGLGRRRGAAREADIAREAQASGGRCGRIICLESQRRSHDGVE
jgi:hypothetical protein